MATLENTSTVIDCAGKTTREINREIHALMAADHRSLRVHGPGGQHNLAVGITEDVEISFDGPVGYFLGGMMDGPRLSVAGNCGWSAGECMLSGEIVIDGYGGNSVGAAMRGGTIVVRGDAGARAGVSMKGGTLLVGGSVGYMSGFMMQKGILIVCGNAGPALGDSMYEGQIFVGGALGEPGNDAQVGDPTDDDRAMVTALLARYGVPHPGDFKKITAGRRLWNFSKREMGLWIEAL